MYQYRDDENPELLRVPVETDENQESLDFQMNQEDEPEDDKYQVESDNEEYLNRKYGYNYRYLKSIYPPVSALPKEEVYPMIDLLYKKGDSLEEAEKYLKEYIKEREPYWFNTWLRKWQFENKGQERSKEYF